jgi:hypothetical protein
LALAVVSLGVMVTPSWAQEAEKTEKAEPAAQREDQKSEQVRKVLRLKYVSVRSLGEIFQGWNVVITGSETLGVAALRGEPETVAEVEQVIRELDVPSTQPDAETDRRNAEVVFYLLSGREESEDDLKNIGALEPVVRELKKKFPQRGYRVLETAVATARRSSKVEITGTLGSLPNAPPSPVIYTIRSQVFPLAGEPAATVWLKDLHLSMRVPVYADEQRRSFSFMDIGIQTDLYVPGGHTIVVGKTAASESLGTLFLVVTARVIE